jgi:hypothetical protein
MINNAALRIISRTCPVCGADSKSGRVEVTAKINPSLDDLENIQKKWEGFHSKTSFFPYTRCGICKVLYNQTYFDDDSVDYLYSSIADNTSGAPMETHNKTQRRYVRLLVEAGIERGPLIEIGPDLGLAAKEVVKTGQVTDLYFVEKNRSSYESLSSMAESIPTQIVSDLSQLREGIRASSGILIHVLDHVIQPRESLLLLRTNLRPGAKILIVVHNEASLLRKMMRGLWPPFRLQHPHLFNPLSLKTLLEYSGFTNVVVQPSTNYMPIRHAFMLGASSLGLPKVMAKLVPKVSLPLRLGNIVATAECV